ncbi:cytochrome c oxidase assembly protein [Faunimonas sp. B44]|uniref:cytochrome c oxidase assembly protein n=1 Tax=Faunimonas sp. B44 TaxID=3461493 RepID=UPI004044D494
MKTSGARNRFLAIGLASVVLGMIGMAYAAVPLYDLFCKVTGYGGTTQVASGESDRVLEREVYVRFDANVVGLPWRFRPEVPQVKVRLGETATVDFIATNTSDVATVGTSTFNVTPDAAGSYFNKIACFCFTRQDLGPGESIRMGVQFFVSPDMVDDRNMKPVRAITLSYTFFPAEPAGQPVARSEADGASKPL